MELRRDGTWLVAELDGDHDLASWAVVGGGLTVARRVVWHQVRDDDLDLETDPVALLQRRLAARGMSDAVAMLTSSDLGRYRRAEVEIAGARARAVATVGLSNRLAVGDEPSLRAVGTINLLVLVHRPLSTGALLETLSIAVQARTVAVLSLGLGSKRSRRPSTGTGTDCVVVAAPRCDTPPAIYAGMHTPLGAAVGRVVLRAVADGGQAWLERAP